MVVPGSKRQRLAVAGVIAVLVLVVGVWWVRRDDSFVAEPAPLVKPVIYGERITRIVDADVGLGLEDEAQRDCVMAKVSDDVALVEAMGDTPKASPRFGDVEKLAARCAAVASTAQELKAMLAKRKQPEPNETQLRCMSEAMDQYPEGERDQVLHDEFANLPPGPLRDKARELLAICGLDSSMVPPPG